MNETEKPKLPTIAEPAVATYGRPHVVYGKPAPRLPRFIAGIEAPEPVWKFAQQNDLTPYLEMVIAWVREFFPTAGNFALEYIVDPEVDNYSWLEVHFYVFGTVEEIYQQYQRLNQKRTQHLPFEKSDLIGVIFGWRE